MRKGLIEETDIVLRPAVPGDLPALSRLRGDREAQALLMGHPEARSGDDTAAWISRRAAAADGAFFAIADTAACLGFAQLTARHGLDRHARFGIALLPEARGRNVGFRAMNLLINEARESGLRKLSCEVRADNGAALKLYRNLGFRDVGVLRAHYDDSAQVWDVILMEKLLAEHST